MEIFDNNFVRSFIVCLIYVVLEVVIIKYLNYGTVRIGKVKI